MIAERVQATLFGKIGEWVDKFNSLDSESQQTIVTMDYLLLLFHQLQEF